MQSVRHQVLMRTPFVGHILDTFTFVDVDALSPYGRKQVTKAIKDLTKHPKSRLELFMNVHMEKLHVFLVRIADCECPNTRMGPIACRLCAAFLRAVCTA